MRAHVRRSAVWLHHEADLLECASPAPPVPLRADGGVQADGAGVGSTGVRHGTGGWRRLSSGAASGKQRDKKQ